MVKGCDHLVRFNPLRHQMAKGGAIPAFNFYTFSQLQGIVAAACHQRAPAFVQISRRTWSIFDRDVLTWLVQSYIPTASGSYAFAHLDHGWSVEVVQEALDMGFSSVMFDGSHLDIAENICRTLQAVEAARSAGVIVEAEVGIVGRPGVESTCTSVAEAVQLQESTKPDFLAISIGNCHGAQPVSLDFEVAKAVRRRTGCRLSLHGGTGVSQEDLARAVDVGFSKFNFATAIDLAERNTYSKLSAGTDLRKSNEIQALVVKNVKAYCLSKYKELESCRSPS